MKGRFIIPVVIALTLMTIATVTTPVYGAEQNSSIKQDNLYQDFMFDLIRFDIIKTIRREYNAGNESGFGYKTNRWWIRIVDSHFEMVSPKPFENYRKVFIVSLKIQPSYEKNNKVVNLNHYDIITFKVYPELLRTDGANKGIELMKYEKKVELVGNRTDVTHE
ncbi:hypothetical protein LSG31_14095 [Fodinisporobacter ferrooxydans]|uniref:DUF3888 domain-containing protein n=1 Tax=Fodinisporobacter ferrooxydans TaxID=2901836 RepID=A0ABY4CMI8_9BACL|nr:hypothetical protein LSG31_14095 [Alicyclobacillaceae bacterium MYW30-H2]